MYSNQAKTTFEPPLGCFERLQRWLGEKNRSSGSNLELLPRKIRKTSALPIKHSSCACFRASVSRRLEAAPLEENAAALDAVRPTMQETYIALEYYTQAQPKYATAFGRDIVASIPAGSIYFGGTVPGRGLVTALCKSHAEAAPSLRSPRTPSRTGAI